MSISVAITRRPEPLEDDGPRIEREEWLSWAEQSSDFREPPKEELSWPSAAARVWMHDGRPLAVFDWDDGEIIVKNPDQRTLARMKRIAMELDAEVISETGELFSVDGESAGFLPGYP